MLDPFWWPSVCLITALIAGWVYSDARDRQDPDPWDWVAVVLVLSVFGLMIYLFMRRTKSNPPTTGFNGYIKLWGCEINFGTVVAVVVVLFVVLVVAALRR